MKRKITVFFICLSFPFSILVQGQIFSSTGLKTGMTISNQSIRFSPLDYYTMDTKPLLGPGIGLFLETFKGERFSFQLDLAYLGKGSKTNIESISVDHLNDNRITANSGNLTKSKFYYYTCSPMLRYFSPAGNLNAYFLLGPRFDFLSTYKSDSKYPLESQNEFILGLTGAFGVEKELNKMNVFAEIQYQTDLMPVTNEGSILINNNILFIALGIRFIKDESE